MTCSSPLHKLNPEMRICCWIVCDAGKLPTKPNEGEGK